MERYDYEEEESHENADGQTTDERSTDELPENADSTKSEAMPEAVA